jgi:hypothetical protein
MARKFQITRPGPLGPSIKEDLSRDCVFQPEGLRQIEG